MATVLDHDRDVTVYLIPDMTKDERVRDKDIVTKGNARFYAGVPIRSPQGHSIGAYCIIDDEPREGLTPTEISFMKDMTTVIMVHLERTRASEASLRSERMLRGLGSFVEGNFSVQDWWMQAGNAQDTQSETLLQSEQWSEEQFASHNYKGVAVPADIGRKPSAAISDDHREILMSSNEGRMKSSRSSSEASVRPLNHDPVADKQTSNKQQDLATTDVKSTFSRAANLIRDVTDMDEAIFYDASVGTFGGLVEAPSDRHRQLSDSSHPETDDAQGGAESDNSVDSTRSNASRHDTQSREQPDKPCEVLGFAAPDRCSLDGHHPPETAKVMTEGFLRSLLQRYPTGKIFTFDEETMSDAEVVDKPTSRVKERPRSTAKQPSFSRRKEVVTLKKVFPNVRSLAIVPLFDSSKDKWFAGGIVWTADPMRVLSSELELSYLAAFGNSIMAEVHRLESKRADTAKSKFISSVSHELRSPLHGILGSVECLQDTELDTFQENLVHTVETCGKTLLDTIDHLLDYAKINNFVNKPRDRASSTKSNNNQSRNGDDGQKTFALDVDVDLSVIAEETMETVFAGYDFTTLGGSDSGQKRDAASSAAFTQHTQKALENVGELVSKEKRNVLIIVDINKAADSHWIFRTQAGAW